MSFPGLNSIPWRKLVTEFIETWHETMNYGEGSSLFDCALDWGTDKSDESYVIGAAVFLGDLKL